MADSDDATLRIVLDDDSSSTPPPSSAPVNRNNAQPPVEPWSGANTWNRDSRGRRPTGSNPDYWGAAPNNQRSSADADREREAGERSSFRERLDNLAGRNESQAGGGRGGPPKPPPVHPWEEGPPDDGGVPGSRNPRYGFGGGSGGQGSTNILSASTGRGLIGASVGGAAGAAIGSMGGPGGAEAFGAVGAVAGALISAINPAAAAFVGIAATTIIASKAIASFADTVADTIKDFSGQVSGALAQRDNAIIQARLRRAEQIGPQMAEHIRKQTETQVNMEDALTNLVDAAQPFIEVVDEFLLQASRVLKQISKYLAGKEDDEMKDRGIEELISAIDQIRLPGGLPDIGPKQGRAIPIGIFQ